MDSRDDRTRRDPGSTRAGGFGETRRGGESGEETASGADAKAEQGTSLRGQVSIPQVSGAALASVTAAFLGSQLGVAGTIAGAGMTSVIITVGGVVYQRSLEKTKEKAVLAAARASERAKAADKRVAAKRPAGSGGRPTEVRSAGTSAAEGHTRRHPTTREEPAATRRIQVGSGSAMHWPGGELVDGPPPEPAERTWVGRAEPEATRVVQVAPAFSRKRRSRGMLAVGSGLAAFVVAMVVVTGFEGMTGKPLSGGDRGTTVGRVFKPAGNPVEPQPEPAPETSAEPTATPETSGAEQPSETAPSSGQQQPSGDSSGTGTRPAQPTGDQPTGSRPTDSGSTGGGSTGSTAEPTGQQQPGLDQQRFGDVAEPGGTAE